MLEEYLQVMTTTGGEDEARKLARMVLDERLAACVQIVGPIHSLYWSEDGVEDVDEFLCIIKTTVSRFGDLEDRIKAEHSYELPEITATSITHGSLEYLRWVSDEARGIYRKAPEAMADVDLDAQDDD